MIVWDTGAWENLTTDDDERSVEAAEALAAGHLTVALHRHKLQGGFALTRISPGGDGRWLLVRVDDEHADARRNPVSTQRESVLSGRTVDEVGKEQG